MSKFLDYKTSKRLMNLGFEQPCFGWYISEKYEVDYGYVEKDDLLRDAVFAITPAQAIKFFREDFKLFSTISLMSIDVGGQDSYRYSWWFSDLGTILTSLELDGEDKSPFGFLVFEQAELDLIEKMIIFVEENFKNK